MVKRKGVPRRNAAPSAPPLVMSIDRNRPIRRRRTQALDEGVPLRPRHAPGDRAAGWSYDAGGERGRDFGNTPMGQWNAGHVRSAAGSALRSILPDFTPEGAHRDPWSSSFGVPAGLARRGPISGESVEHKQMRSADREQAQAFRALEATGALQGPGRFARQQRAALAHWRARPILNTTPEWAQDNTRHANGPERSLLGYSRARRARQERAALGTAANAGDASAGLARLRAREAEGAAAQGQAAAAAAAPVQFTGTKGGWRGRIIRGGKKEKK